LYIERRAAGWAIRQKGVEFALVNYLDYSQEGGGGRRIEEISKLAIYGKETHAGKHRGERLGKAIYDEGIPLGNGTVDQREEKRIKKVVYERGTNYINYIKRRERYQIAEFELIRNSLKGERTKEESWVEREK